MQEQQKEPTKVAFEKTKRCAFLTLLLLTTTFAITACGSDEISDSKKQYTKTSLANNFKGVLTCQCSAVDINKLQTWALTLENQSSLATTISDISVDGGMPEHNHGFPTSPTIEKIELGRYQIKGVRFHMPGSWQLKFIINYQDPVATDTLIFDLELH